jgi:hypothetical protein
MIGLVIIAIGVVVFILPHLYIWGGFLAGSVSWKDFFAIVMVLLLCVAIHEGLHIVGFRWIAKVPFSQLKVGFKWEYLTPYAHCKVPVPARAYRWAVMLPGIILGVLPALIGLSTGTGILTLAGTFLFAAAGGDIAVLWAIRDVQYDAMVLDHPERVGCLILETVERS